MTAREARRREAALKKLWSAISLIEATQATYRDALEGEPSRLLNSAKQVVERAITEAEAKP